jgi:hypothetical protein
MSQARWVQRIVNYIIRYTMNSSIKINTSVTNYSLLGDNIEIGEKSAYIYI